jgi:hypothetical protein
MRRSLIRTFAFALMLPCAALLAVRPAPPATRHAGDAGDAISPREVTPLFNGRNFDGLYTWLVDTKREDPRGVFSVRDGVLRISGDGFGYLSTDRSYRDYRLVVEFKWGDRDWRGREGKAKDSGVFLHSAGPDGNSWDGNGAWKAAIECQVMQGAVGDLLLINGRDEKGKAVPVRLTTEAAKDRDAAGWPWWKRGGKPVKLVRGGRVNGAGKSPEWKDVAGFRGPGDVEKPAGEWNTVECVCDGSRVTVKVNGTVVNEAYDVFPSEGPILLQCEGSEVFIRRFELHPLKALPGGTSSTGVPRE